MTMALVASSSSSHTFTFSPNAYEWPKLNEHCERSRSRQMSLLVRSVSCGNSATKNNNINLVITAGKVVDHFVKPTTELCEYSTRKQFVKINGTKNMHEFGTADVNIVSCAVEKQSHSLYKPSELESTRQTEQEIPESSQQALQEQHLLPSLSNATSEFTESNLVSNVTQTVEDRHLFPQNEDKEYTNKVSSLKRKKKKKIKKIRHKSMRKWRQFDSAELGFTVSHAFNDNLMFTNINSSVSEAPQPGASEYGVEGNTEINSNNDIIQNDKDNIDFFRALGIDVLNFDYNNGDNEDLLLWDGVSFSNEQPTSWTQQKVKERSKPKVKSKLEASSKTGSSLPVKFKLDKHEQIHNFVPSLTVFSSMKKCDKNRLFELECASSKRIYIRRDRHRRQEKPHRAVKSKHSRFILQNTGRKRLYMHHRLIKMHNLDLDFRGSVKSYSVPPMPKSKVAVDVAKDAFRANRKQTPSNDPPAVVQNLNHALHESNLSGHLANDLAAFLISLQHRDMTPEDYDMLLRLDDTVKPKTVSQNVLKKLRTEQIGPNGPEQGSSEWEPMCTICMEAYSLGQERKFLPCGHDFHSPCIDKWLKDSSMNCPLDGLPIDS